MIKCFKARLFDTEPRVVRFCLLDPNHEGQHEARLHRKVVRWS